MNYDTGPVRSVLPGMAWPGLPASPGPALLSILQQLDQTQWWSSGAILDQQLRQAALVIAHARDTVPFYAQHLAGWEPGGSFGLDDYRRLPILTRRDIQAAGKSMLSAAIPDSHGPLHTLASSGSTAEPIVLSGTQVTDLFWQALLMREHLWHGRDFSAKLAAIRSKTENSALPDWGIPADLLFRTGPSVVLNLAVDLDEQIRWIEREDPAYLISFPTNLHSLARRCLELGVRFRGLREARTYGEALRADLRATVREAWGVEVVDAYSSEELGYIALQCPDHEHYHVQAESLLVEVLRPDGASCQPGEIGQLVFTTLHNFATPLVRYANGDYAEVGAPCPCGRGLPVLTRVAGRLRNMLVRPDGGRNWPSFPFGVWRELAPIRQLQFVQDALDHIEVRLVLPRELTAEERAGLTKVFQECLGYPFRITLRRVEAIERSAGLKFEDFISEIA